MSKAVDDLHFSEYVPVGLPRYPLARRCSVCGSAPIEVTRREGWQYRCATPDCPPAMPDTHTDDTPDAALAHWNYLNGGGSK